MLRRRQISQGQSSSHSSGSVIPLTQFVPGQRAIIVGTVHHATSAVVTRLQQLGFRSAASITAIRDI